MLLIREVEASKFFNFQIRLTEKKLIKLARIGLLESGFNF